MFVTVVACVLIVGAGDDVSAVATIPAVDARDYGPCGPVALYCVCRLLGRDDITLSRIHELAGPPDARKRHSFAALADAAAQSGLYPVALTASASKLRSLRLPAIAHMRYSYNRHREHFVAVVDCSAEGVLLVDPPHSPLRVTWESFVTSQ